MKKQRLASIEFLRILCILPILMIHLFGDMSWTATGLNLYISIIVKILSNVAVTCFILISGYFSIKRRWKRVSDFYWQVTFYGLIYLAIYLIYALPLTRSNILSFIFPVFTRYWWFATCYFALMLLSPFLNEITERFNKNEFKKILITLIIIFIIIPTFFIKGITADSGKNITNMVTVYLTGRYLRLYSREIKINKHIVLCIVAFIITYLLNVVCTFIKGGYGIVAPFGRDNSLTVFLLSILIFMLFTKIDIQNKFIDTIAVNIFGVYLGEEIVRFILSQYFNLYQYSNEVWLWIAIIGIDCGIFALCIMVESVRSKVFRRLDVNIYNLEVKYYLKIKDIVGGGKRK